MPNSINTLYNFYHPEIDEKIINDAKKKGILGWLRDEKINFAAPQGKPIKFGFESNLEFTPEEHNAAAATLHARAKRIQNFIENNKIPSRELGLLQTELADIEGQKQKHIEAGQKPALSKEPVPVTKSSLPYPSLQLPEKKGTLSKLLKAMRAKRPAF